MIKGSAIAAAERMVDKIDDNYCLRVDNILEIVNHFGTDSPVDILLTGFNLGYSEGQKAEKARLRREKRK